MHPQDEHLHVHLYTTSVQPLSPSEMDQMIKIYICLNECTWIRCIYTWISCGWSLFRYSPNGQNAQLVWRGERERSQQVYKELKTRSLGEMQLYIFHIHTHTAVYKCSCIYSYIFSHSSCAKLNPVNELKWHISKILSYSSSITNLKYTHNQTCTVKYCAKIHKDI